MPNDKKLTREDSVDPDRHEVVRLGDSQYEVWPQKIGWLRSQLGVALGNLGDLKLESGNVLDILGSRAYAVLKVFIPKLMPEHEFHGFATKEAWQKGDYDAEYDKSPTPPQLRAAFTAASAVNEVELLKHLGKLIGPETIRAALAGMMADTLEERRTKNSAKQSVTTGPDTPSTMSGTPHLTSVE